MATISERLQCSNLELWSTRQPCGQRVSDKLEWAVEFIRGYAPELLVEGGGDHRYDI